MQGFINDLLTGATPFDLELKRRTDELGLTYNGSSSWSLGLDYQRHESRGQQPLGSGTYERITDVNGDGTTDYDYFFSIRGVELPATIDYDTTNASRVGQLPPGPVVRRRQVHLLGVRERQSVPALRQPVLVHGDGRHERTAAAACGKRVELRCHRRTMPGT